MAFGHLQRSPDATQQVWRLPFSKLTVPQLCQSICSDRSCDHARSTYILAALRRFHVTESVLRMPTLHASEAQLASCVAALDQLTLLTRGSGGRLLRSASSPPAAAAVKAAAANTLLLCQHLCRNKTQGTLGHNVSSFRQMEVTTATHVEEGWQSRKLCRKSAGVSPPLLIHRGSWRAAGRHRR